jgi:long-chain acyl-CoA synthetase
MASSPVAAAERWWAREAYSQLSDFGTLVQRSAETFGGDVFLRPAEHGVDPLSFRDVEQFVRGFEVFLEKAGVAPGESCAVISNNTTAMVLQFIAMIATDRVFVPINPNSSADDITFIVDDCSAKAVVYERSLEEKASFLKESCELVPVGSPDEFIAEVMALAKERPARQSQPKPGSIAEIVYTTGSTGRPKGVQLTHRNLFADLFGIGEAFGFTRGEKFLTVTPLFHNSGQIMTTLIPLYCGGVTTVIRPDMGFINFWHYVDTYEPAWTLVMPSHIALMLDRKDVSRKGTLKGILCGGAKIEPQTQKEFERRFSVPIFCNYGLTESTSIATCVRPEDADRASGSVGRPLSINEVKIFKSNREAAANEVGEIWIRGDNIFAGYVNLPGVYAEKVQFGWLHTGDLGFTDATGAIHIVDRIDNMVLVGGENVYPSEIERFVPELEGVSEALLVAIPDRIMGRELILVYRLAPGATAKVKEWKQHLFSKLVSFKVPRRFIDVKDVGLEDFPRSQSGKLLRKRLQAAVEARLNPDTVAAPAVAETRASRVFTKAAEVIADVLEIDVVDVDEQLSMDRAPSWDSMNHLKLVMSLESAFGVTFTPAQISEMTDVRAIVRILENAK